MKINTGSMFTAHRVPSTTVHSNPDTTARMEALLKLAHQGHRVESLSPLYLCVVDNHLV